MRSSLVIPAHDESAVIRSTLSAMTGAREIAAQIIVVCNGCTDDTADRARAFGEWVTVVETEIASKSNALNLGDRAASGFPRFYLDADVILSADAVCKVARILAERPEILAAAPMIQFDLANRPWAVRAFYEIWSMLPYCREGMIGSGVYALSEAGRKRFGQFPGITADDAFVRLHFAPHERLTVETCRFTVTPPTTLRGVIKIKTRAHFGDYELKKRFPHLFANKQDGHGGALRKLARRPSLWTKIGVYLFVRLASRLLGMRRFYFGSHRHWERDESSRVPAAAELAPGSTE